MLKTEIEFIPALLEFADNSMTLLFYLGEDNDGDIKITEELHRINGAIYPDKIGYIKQKSIKSITKLEVKNEQ